MSGINYKIFRILSVLLIALLAAMVFAVLWQVLTRFILRRPSSYTEELAGFLLVWIGILGASHAFYTKSHLGIDLLARKLKSAHRRKLEMFVHLMDAQSRVWGGEDRLDLHPPTWEAGDLLVQLHRVPLAGDAPPGLYQLELGLYSPITMKRLAVYDGPELQQAVGDRLLLAPITVIE